MKPTPFIRALTLLTLLLLTLPGAEAIRPVRIYRDLTSPAPLFEIIPMPADPCSHKAVEIRASVSGKRLIGTYGVIFAAIDSTDFYFARLQADPGNGDDIRNDRRMTLSVGHRRPDASIETLATASLRDGLDLDRFDNSLAAEINCATGLVTILAGNAAITPQATITIPTPRAQGAIGVTTSGNARIDLAVGEYLPDYDTLLSAAYTSAQTDSLLAAYSTKRTPSAPEGLWQYLDRNTDPAYMRPGGTYTLAIIPSGPNFNIIYIDGAEINASRWHKGMLKGTLRPTPFQGHYNLTWYDAELHPHTAECSATLESPLLLRLDFPLLKSSLRLTRPH